MPSPQALLAPRRESQALLWCGCGARVHARGRCSRCYSEWRRFGGLRWRVLNRDGRACPCGEVHGLVVHHRKPGLNDCKRLATLCRRCHLRVHRTLRPRYGWPDWLKALWREQHRGLAEQWELTLAGGEVQTVAGEQGDLFGGLARPF